MLRFFGLELDTILVNHEIRVVKNVTVSLPETVARWVRVEAARNDQSVSRYLATILEERISAESEYDSAMAGFLGREPQKISADGAYPSRNELHDRQGIC